MTDLTGRLSTAIADRYKIEHHLGAGGMAIVYLAHDLKHERTTSLAVPVVVRHWRRELERRFAEQEGK